MIPLNEVNSANGIASRNVEKMGEPPNTVDSNRNFLFFDFASAVNS